MWTQANHILNQAAERIARRVADFLPGLLALALVLLLTIVVAWIVRGMVRRSLRRFDFDCRVGQWGFSAMAEWSPSRSPALLMARLAFWAVMLMGGLAGISTLDANHTNMLVIQMFAYLPNVVAGLLILIVGTVMARLLARGSSSAR